jgi:hypothetical protein
MACPCFYLYRRATLPLFADFCAGTKTLKERDAPGNFLTWLHKRAPVFAYRISGRFDIGGLDSYVECENWFQERLKLKAAAGDKGKAGDSSQSQSAAAEGGSKAAAVEAKKEETKAKA